MKFEIQAYLKLKQLILLLGYDKIVDLLIQNGANINAARNVGDTPLFKASQNGYL